MGGFFFPDFSSNPTQDNLTLPVDSVQGSGGSQLTAGDYTLGPAQGTYTGAAQNNSGTSTFWKNALNLASLGTVIAGYATQGHAQRVGATYQNPPPPETFANTIGKTLLWLGVAVLVTIAIMLAVKHSPRSVR